MILHSPRKWLQRNRRRYRSRCCDLDCWLPWPQPRRRSNPQRRRAAAQKTVLPGTAPDFVQVAVGENHSCALQGSGRVQCWGANDDSQLNVPDGVRFKRVTAGSRFSCGIRTDGEITCWGQNDHQQIEAPQGRFTDIDAGWDHVCALSERSAACWGWNANERAPPPQGVPFAAIGAGAEHSCGLTLGGDLVCWGKNDDGRATSRTGPFLALAVGSTHTCVLRQDGTVACQGMDDFGQSSPPLTGFTQIATGSMHGCGIATDNSLRCWGLSTNSADSTILRVPPGEFTSVAAGWNIACGVALSRSAQCWDYGSLSHRISPYRRLLFVYDLPSTAYAEPVDIAPWPSGDTLVAERHGLISRVENGTKSRTLLDLSDKLFIEGGFTGLLSVAVDPESEELPYLYAYFTAKPKHSNADRPSLRLARFPIVDGRADKNEGLDNNGSVTTSAVTCVWTLRALVTTVEPYEFGPDGMLYLSMGDADCFDCPQSLDSLFGKILRIDVRGATADQPYRIPDDNPFLRVPDARPEIWALGFRNPWRMSIDSRQGMLWVGDVGHDSEEEVSMVVAGANLGWPAFEGAGCLVVDESIRNYYGIETGYSCEEFQDAVKPVVSYKHTGSVCAVVGGVVYRGSAISWLDGVYLFGDYCSGRVWALEGAGDARQQMVLIADLSRPISSFGIDGAGEVNVLVIGGPILRIVESEP